MQFFCYQLLNKRAALVQFILSLSKVTYLRVLFFMERFAVQLSSQYVPKSLVRHKAFEQTFGEGIWCTSQVVIFCSKKLIISSAVTFFGNAMSNKSFT